MAVTRLEAVYRRLHTALPTLNIVPKAWWSDSTTLGAGLSSFFLVKPRTLEGLLAVLKLLREFSIPVRTLGCGSNIVGSDSETEAVFIRLDTGYFTRISPAGTNMLEGRAGLLLPEFIDRAAERGLGGASGLSGIPASLGGAVMMNAGANGVSTAGFVRMIEGVRIKDGSLYLMDSIRPEDWGYRRSPVPKDVIVTGVVFEFQPVDPASEKQKIAAERRRRAEVCPPGRSAGSVFLNPSADTPAGRLLERAGCSGMSAGGFRVSARHANWIVRSGPGPASEKDFVALACRMHAAAHASSGIALHTELHFINQPSKSTIEEAFSDKMKILVLKGGVSSEREVSLVSGKGVADALRSEGHLVKEYDITELKLTEDMRWADVVYPVLHGGFGEDGRLQKMLEDAGIRFVGCGSAACALCMDKVAGKRVMDKFGLRNAPSVVVEDSATPVIDKFGFPLIVKPTCEGSTYGLSLVENESQWKKALELAFKYDRVVLVEKFIRGIEATVGLLDGKALPLVEIRYPGKLYDYDAKYTHKKAVTQYICPPTGISEAAQKEAQDLAEKFYRAVGARDMLRVDMIIDDRGHSWLLEGNTLPGCTPSSLLPMAAKAAGISFAQMCSKLAQAAASRK